MKALISVYDKAGIVAFARTLVGAGFELVSTGGTHDVLADAGLPVQQISDLTGFPEILDGRVKTLHPTVHAGILARRDVAGHTAELDRHDIDTIDMVIVNLYPFVRTVTSPGGALADALENIDIGGPTMIRAAAKNFAHVLVVVDPSDYVWMGERLAAGASSAGSRLLTFDERKTLARKAFQHVALYDTAISSYLGDGDGLTGAETTLGYTKVHDLRYGENPHQRASLYADQLSSDGIVRAEQLHGLDPSFTNVLDADAAWTVVSDFAEPAAVVIKHTNPCGLAVHVDQPTAYRRAFEGDTVSAYGGTVGFNRTVTAETAEAMKGVLYDIVVAPDYEPEALSTLQKRRRTRVLRVPLSEGNRRGLDVRSVSGGVLIQTADAEVEDPALWKVVTERRPTETELRDLTFAWRAAKHVKSNAIVLARDGSVVGMGAGQPNRVNSVRLALSAAGDRAKGSVLASDAFFPFADNVELAAEGGVAAVAQPGGSIRDDEVIAAANQSDMAMVMTGTRHFKH